MSSTLITLALITVFIGGVSFLLSPRALTTGSFYSGLGAGGEAPGVLALTFSQVTTWIFARSIMNAAVLGYAYGISGALAYAAYYLSFVTGARIVDSLRFRHGFGSVQAFLADRFGPIGKASYNVVVAVRLISEVFANLLVIGLIFGSEGSIAYIASVLLVGAVTLGYSLVGGLSASIRTDVLQMTVFLAVLAVLVVIALGHGGPGPGMIAASSPDITEGGWVLLAVALLQIWSYPLHDPVMMDRGFIADRRTTAMSFNHAAWISFLCIMAFGLIGVWAGLQAGEGEALIAALTRLIGDWPMVLFSACLVISCMSTLDSTFASAAKLTVVDMGLGTGTVRNGRAAMLAFLAGGLALVFVGSDDLFAAVAVSGTASMFLAPVVFFSLWGGRTDVPVWSYGVAFVAALVAAAVYFTDSSGYSDIVGAITGFGHKYSKLLVLSAAALAIGCGAFGAGIGVARIGGRGSRS